MKIILLGAPGAGKGTQAEKISEALHIPQISTGNIIREALKSGSEVGLKAKSFIESGKLVPDDDCVDGFILDGFPRTIAQAEALDSMGVAIDRVLDINVADDVIAARLSGRRVCESCGSSYHLVSKKPAVEGVCDKCGGTLIQRKDDHPDTVADRLKVYHEQTEPLKAYYEKKGLLRVVDGQDTVADTTYRTFCALED